MDDLKIFLIYYSHSPLVGEARRYSDEQFHMSIRPYIVCNNFIVYTITQKILEQSAPIFVGTLGTLGQHEFAFGFCGCIRSLAVGNPCYSSTLVMLQWQYSI